MNSSLELFPQVVVMTLDSCNYCASSERKHKTTGLFTNGKVSNIYTKHPKHDKGRARHNSSAGA